MSLVENMLNKFFGTAQISNNPMAQNVINMYQNKDSKGLQQMAENICRENGTTIDEMRKKLGI